MIAVRAPAAAAFFVFFLLLAQLPRQAAAGSGIKLPPPAEGAYHSAHPYFGPYDDAVDADEIDSFVALSGKKIVWSYVSFNWFGGVNFPAEACRILHGKGIVPLVGIMPWSAPEQGRAERVYTLERILRGDFDADLRRSAKEAASLGFPIMMEFGPEANGSWFPWSGAWNGRSEDRYGERGKPDGPERFRDAYRRVADIFRAGGAIDVTWVFHISSNGSPKEAWNYASNYYPGDDWVDWIGVSVYGRLRGDEPAEPFDRIMKRVYPGLCALSPTRPIALLELGVSDSPKAGDKAAWIAEALGSVTGARYPRIRAVSWWNKKLRPDGSPSTLEIDSSAEALAAYRDGARSLVDEPHWGE
ncbi:MAG: beta-mannanase [Synergistaceae bacterium]|nr:beta-mannanase [Synergistaceae bacterium]